jgi:hypothetical protein
VSLIFFVPDEARGGVSGAAATCMPLVLGSVLCLEGFHSGLGSLYGHTR